MPSRGGTASAMGGPSWALPARLVMTKGLGSPLAGDFEKWLNFRKKSLGEGNNVVLRVEAPRFGVLKLV